MRHENKTPLDLLVVRRAVVDTTLNWKAWHLHDLLGFILSVICIHMTQCNEETLEIYKGVSSKANSPKLGP